MVDFVFRRAVIGDAASVTALVRAAYAKWAPVIGREPMPMRVEYERTILDHHLEVLVHAGAVVAVLEVIDRPEHLWIENVAVSPALQGKGLGRRLLVRAEELASMLGHNRIALLTNGAFEANVSL